MFVVQDVEVLRERFAALMADPAPRRTLYEVLSPDVFLRPFVESYTRLSVLYEEVRTFFAPSGDPYESEIARKTESLVRERAESWGLVTTRPAVEIDEKTLDALAASRGSPRAFTAYRVLQGEKVSEAQALAPRLVARIDEFPNHAHQAGARRALKAALYKELLPVVGKERMVEIAEQVLKLVRA